MMTAETATDGRLVRTIRFLAVALVLFAPAAGVILALITVARGQVRAVDVALFAVGFLLTGLGVTVGYHRLAAHRSLETSPLLRGLMLVLGSMAVEGPVVPWVANHLQHHAYTDLPQDPHSPNEGFGYAHYGWLFQFPGADASKYAPLILRDRVAVFVSTTFAIWVAVGYIIPFLIGGWEGFIWGGLLRQFAVQHVTFAVNSVCHRYGSRPFRTGDMSTNNWVVGILGLGEGWHNNHHAFPSSAFHGLHPWEPDISGYVIRGLAAARLVWNVKRPSIEQIRKRSA
jgi:stearoyl-CoA desaturase (delta-9 desaturase)